MRIGNALHPAGILAKSLCIQNSFKLRKKKENLQASFCTSGQLVVYA